MPMSISGSDKIRPLPPRCFGDFFRLSCFCPLRADRRLISTYSLRQQKP